VYEFEYMEEWLLGSSLGLFSLWSIFKMYSNMTVDGFEKKSSTNIPFGKVQEPFLMKAALHFQQRLPFVICQLEVKVVET
jgi:hypothetical protein